MQILIIPGCRLCPMRSLRRRGGIIKHISNSVFKLTKKVKAKLHTCLWKPIESPTHPMDRIFHSACPTKFFGVRLFCASPVEIDRRLVENVTAELVPTHFLKLLKSSLFGAPQPGEATATDTTFVICGPSGSGKTCSVIALSQPANCAIVAYLIMPSFAVRKANGAPTEFGQAIAQSGGTEEVRAEARNSWVLRSLVDMLYTIVPQDVFVRMAEIPPGGGGNSPFRFIIFVDEVGGVDLMPAVRALCAITANEIKSALLQRLADGGVSVSLDHITFLLCVAGTGIGTHDDGTIGSTNSTFKVLTAYSGSFDVVEPIGEVSKETETALHERTNRAVFASYFASLDIESLGKSLHPVFWGMISQNMRMAAILGSIVSHEFGASVAVGSPAERRFLFERLDLSQFLLYAYFRFRSLNGLSAVSFASVPSTLHKVLRMHWYPHALTVDADRMQTKYGLIVDRTRTGDTSATYSPKMFPFFTTALLATLGGCPVITRSLVSGASLEEYTLLVMHMLACAANDEDLLVATLDHNGGQLVPMKDAKLRPHVGVAEAVAANAASANIAPYHLPPSKDREFVAVIRQLEHAEPAADGATAACGAVDGTADGDVVGETAVMDRIAHSFDSLIKTFTAQPQPPNQARTLHIASMMSFDKAPFADSVLFNGGSMIMFRAKDYAGGYALENFEAELTKMGGMGHFVGQIGELMKHVEEEVGVSAIPAVHATVELGKTLDPQKFLGVLSEFLAAAETTSKGTCGTSDDESLSEADRDAMARFLLMLRRHAQRLQAPRRLLLKLVTMWFRQTGHKITRIYRVFVTPRPIAEADRSRAQSSCGRGNDTDLRVVVDGHSWEVEMVTNVRFVSVDLIRFLPFDAVRRAQRPPPLYGMGQPMRVTKSAEVTPPLPNAADGDDACCRSRRGVGVMAGRKRSERSDDEPGAHPEDGPARKGCRQSQYNNVV